MSNFKKLSNKYRIIATKVFFILHEHSETLPLTQPATNRGAIKKQLGVRTASRI